MRVAVISHTYIVRANRGKLESLARLPEMEVSFVAPTVWRNRDVGERFAVQAQGGGPLSMEPVTAWALGSGSLICYSPLALWRVLRRLKPHVVHLEEEPWSLAAFELSVICGLLRVPLTFFTWQNADGQLALPFRLIQWVVLRRARAAVTGNTEAKVRLERRHFRNPISIIPQLGVDIAAFRSSTAGQALPTVVGYVGRLVPQKGLFVLLEAVARLSPNVRFLLVGNGPLKDTVHEKARVLGLEGRFELHEGVPHSEVPTYLKQMSVLVLPSLTTPTWKEQFGHVLIEAMACGVPVIGSDSGAIPEVVADAGIVVPEGNVEALAAALQDVIATPALRADLAARGRARVEAEYTNEVLALRLAAFWDRLIGEGRRRQSHTSIALLL